MTIKSNERMIKWMIYWILVIELPRALTQSSIQIPTQSTLLTSECSKACPESYNDACVVFSHKDSKECHTMKYSKCVEYATGYNMSCIHLTEYLMLFVDEELPDSLKPKFEGIHAMVRRIQPLNLPETVSIFTLVGALYHQQGEMGDHRGIRIESQFLENSQSVTQLQFTGISTDFDKDIYPNSLTALRFKTCELTEIPKILIKLINLKELYLDQVKLQKFPYIIFDMPNLNEIVIEETKIVNYFVNQEEMNRLTELSTLAIDFQIESCPTGTELRTFKLKVPRIPPSREYSVCFSPNAKRGELLKPKEDGNGTLIAICIIIGLIVIALLIIGWFFYRRRGYFFSKRQIEYAIPLLPIDEKAFSENTELHVLRIKFEEITHTEELARGGFGMVWKGNYRGRAVAVKSLLPERIMFSPDDIDQFVLEIVVMGNLYHPRIVEFVGVAWTNMKNISAVLEYMDMGDLRSVLLSSGINMNWTNSKVQIAIAIAEALQYLHSREPTFIHRDLKSRNVLMDSQMGTKLTDFGLSSDQSKQTMTAGIGTLRWMSPEMINAESYTEKIDIWAFGVILTELSTHQLPFEDFKTDSGCPLGDGVILNGIARGTLRPTLGKTCPLSIQKIADSCLNYNAKERPSAERILFLLHREVKVEIENSGNSI